MIPRKYELLVPRILLSTMPTCLLLLRDRRPNVSLQMVRHCVGKSKEVATPLSDQASDIVWRLYMAPNIGKCLYVDRSYLLLKYLVRSTRKLLIFVIKLHVLKDQSIQQ